MANYLAGMSRSVSGAFNLGSGTRVTINHLTALLADASGLPLQITHGPPRAGDVRHSLADISAARDAFGFAPAVSLEEGLRDYMTWARATLVRR
jgi:UDP-glucose 4-epimerase